MVVLAVPTYQVSVETSFIAHGLVLSNRRTRLAEDTLPNILLVKLNRELFERAIPNLYNWLVVIIAHRNAHMMLSQLSLVFEVIRI